MNRVKAIDKQKLVITDYKPCMHLFNVLVLACLESALFTYQNQLFTDSVRGNCPFCIFLLIKCQFLFKPMKELLNFFVQTAGRKTPELMNKVMCAAEPKCTKKKFYISEFSDFNVFLY